MLQPRGLGRLPGLAPRAQQRLRRAEEALQRAADETQSRAEADQARQRPARTAGDFP